IGQVHDHVTRVGARRLHKCFDGLGAGHETDVEPVDVLEGRADQPVLFAASAGAHRVFDVEITRRVPADLSGWEAARLNLVDAEYDPPFGVALGPDALPDLGVGRAGHEIERVVPTPGDVHEFTVFRPVVENDAGFLAHGGFTL